MSENPGVSPAPRESVRKPRILWPPRSGRVSENCGYCGPRGAGATTAGCRTVPPAGGEHSGPGQAGILCPVHRGAFAAFHLDFFRLQWDNTGRSYLQETVRIASGGGGRLLQLPELRRRPGLHPQPSGAAPKMHNKKGSVKYESGSYKIRHHRYQ